MKNSEFYAVVEQVFGSAYGMTLCEDLVLDKYGLTAEQALEKGEKPIQVWQELVKATDIASELAWAHRLDKKEIQRLLG